MCEEKSLNYYEQLHHCVLVAFGVKYVSNLTFG